LTADTPAGIICPATINGNKTSLLVDSGSQVTCLTPQSLIDLNLDLIHDPRVFVPCGDENEVASPGYVIIKELRVGRHSLRNLKLPVCDVQAACSPAQGILGLDLFSHLGIAVTGVPVNYPEEEDECILTEEPFYGRSVSLEQYAPTPAQRQQLLDGIKVQLERIALSRQILSVLIRVPSCAWKPVTQNPFTHLNIVYPTIWRSSSTLRWLSGMPALSLFPPLATASGTTPSLALKIAQLDAKARTPGSVLTHGP
jgi:hypothetical protein